MRKITFVVANQMLGPRGHDSYQSTSCSPLTARKGFRCENVRLPFQVLYLTLCYMDISVFSTHNCLLIIMLRMFTPSLYLALLLLIYHFRKSANSLVNSRSCAFFSNKQCKKSFFSTACLSHCIPNSCTSLAITFDWISS